VVGSAFPLAWVFGRAGCATVHDHPGRLSDAWFAVRWPMGHELRRPLRSRPDRDGAHHPPRHRLRHPLEEKALAPRGFLHGHHVRGLRAGALRPRLPPRGRARPPRRRPALRRPDARRSGPASACSRWASTSSACGRRTSRSPRTSSLSKAHAGPREGDPQSDTSRRRRRVHRERRGSKGGRRAEGRGEEEEKEEARPQGRSDRAPTTTKTKAS
jgi:hypothetical protein